jgi:hypothetical protein
MPQLPLRIKSLLAVPLVIAFWQLSAVVLANTTIISPEGSAYSSVTTNSSMDGSAWMSLASEKKQPSQGNNDFSESPSDMDEIDGGSDDLNADNSSRHDQDISHFSVTGPNAVTPRAPEVFRALLPLPAPVFRCLHQHIRERAPPTLG